VIPIAKEPGFPFTVIVDDSGGVARTISNDINSLNFATPRGVQDITGVDKSAIERQLLLADMSVTLNMAAFNDAANMSHVVFKTVSSSSVARTTSLAVSGQTLACECLFSDYQLSRGADGSLTASAPGVLADGTVPTWS
jgi:hypothetical protein